MRIELRILDEGDIPTKKKDKVILAIDKVLPEAIWESNGSNEWTIYERELSLADKTKDALVGEEE